MLKRKECLGVTLSASILLTALVCPTLSWAGWVWKANQGGSFTVTGTQLVRFGKSPNWTQKYVSGTVQCKVYYFGVDPIPGVTKYCELFVPSTTPSPSPSPSPTPAPLPSPSPTLVPAPTPSPTPTSADACLSPDFSPLPKAMRSNVKFFAGHYIYVSTPWEYNLVIPTLKEIATMPNVKGVLKKYAWSMLEPSKDDYSGLELIREDLRLVKAQNKKLAVMIQYKFTSPDPSNENPMPNYLKDMTGNDYYYVIPSGYLAKFANPIVVQRFNKLLSKLKEFDSDPAFAAVVFSETANGVKTDSIDTDKYYQGLMQTDRAAACIMLKTPVIQLTNYPTKYLANTFVKTDLDYSVGYGGPDVYTNDPYLIAGPYSYHPSLSNKVPIGMVVASENFLYYNQADHLSKTLNNLPVNTSVDQVMSYALNDLSSNFVFWRKERRDDPYYLALLTKLKGDASTVETNEACPDTYSSCSK
jgi:hypothetical protein